MCKENCGIFCVNCSYVVSGEEYLRFKDILNEVSSAKLECSELSSDPDKVFFLNHECKQKLQKALDIRPDVRFYNNIQVYNTCEHCIKCLQTPNSPDNYSLDFLEYADVICKHYSREVLNKLLGIEIVSHKVAAMTAMFNVDCVMLLLTDRKVPRHIFPNAILNMV